MIATNRTAVFLGAGASAPFGFPLTRDLLPEIWSRLERGELFQRLPVLSDESSNRELLAYSLRRLLPGLGRVDVTQLPWITEILSLVDYSLQMHHALFPGQGEESLRRLRRQLERSLLEVLLPPERYDEDVSARLKRFVDWIVLRARRVGIVSTNYDITVENDLFRRASRKIDSLFDFGFAWQDAGASSRLMRMRPADAHFQILKLHGSLNWLRCASCENIYINPYGRIAHQAFRETVDEHNTCHCGHHKLEMHIVAPSLFRDVRDSCLLEVWRSALTLLQEAQEWVIIGYSFPSEDIAIRSLFTRAFNAHALHATAGGPRITVVQRGREAQPRYRAFFPDCEYLDGGVEQLIDRHE